MAMEQKATQKQTTNVRKIIIIAIFSAFAMALSFVKLPSPVGSVALDSSPGYFVAGFFSPILGGVTGLIGHLTSSGIAGFPLSFVHIPIALLQFCWCCLFGFILRKGNNIFALVAAAVIAVLTNGVIAPILLVLLYPAMKNMMYGIIPFLIVASAINVILAAVAIRILSKLNVPGL
jgi:ABC-type Co2+ transport system permease subunit